MKKNIKKIIVGTVLAASVIGGVVIMNKSDDVDVMTLSEMQTYIKIINYEIERTGEAMILEDVDKDNIYKSINAEIRKNDSIRQKANKDDDDEDYKKIKEAILNKVDKIKQ